MYIIKKDTVYRLSILVYISTFNQTLFRREKAFYLNEEGKNNDIDHIFK